MRNISQVWVVLSVLCSSFAHLFLKLGALRLNVNEASSNVLLGLGTNRWLIAGGALHLLALAFWVIGLRYIALSVAYPFIALGFVLVSLLSWIFLSEAVTGFRLAGMLLITSGVILIART